MQKNVSLTFFTLELVKKLLWDFNFPFRDFPNSIRSGWSVNSVVIHLRRHTYVNILWTPPFLSAECVMDLD